MSSSDPFFRVIEALTQAGPTSGGRARVTRSIISYLSLPKPVNRSASGRLSVVRRLRSSLEKDSRFGGPGAFCLWSSERV